MLSKFYEQIFCRYHQVTQTQNITDHKCSRAQSTGGDRKRKYEEVNVHKQVEENSKQKYPNPVAFH